MRSAQEVECTIKPSPLEIRPFVRVSVTPTFAKLAAKQKQSEWFVPVRNTNDLATMAADLVQHGSEK